MLLLFQSWRNGASSFVRFDRAMALEIHSMLYKLHVPRIRVQPSTIPDSGSGIFAVQPLAKGQVACLYPGVYTPPLPSPARAVGHGGEREYVYLADQITPSGLVAEENAYILNLQQCGGYIDGHHQAFFSSESTRKSLDENPSACGHLINHHARRANVSVVSFLWNDVFRIVEESNAANNSNAVEAATAIYSLPNRRRQDGSPWYLDPMQERIIHFDHQNEEGDNASFNGVRGAAMAASTSINANEELFLHYGLTKPYPKWARKWYTGD